MHNIEIVQLSLLGNAVSLSGVTAHLDLHHFKKGFCLLTFFQIFGDLQIL